MLNEHAKKQVLIGGGLLAGAAFLLWRKGQSGAGIGLAPLPPVSGGYINTDPNASAPMNQPVAGACPPGYLPIPGGSCEAGFSINNWGGTGVNLSIYGGTPGPYGTPSGATGKPGVSVISGGSVTQTSCGPGGCG